MKKTITTIFILPTLKIPRNDLKENGFINCFIADETLDVTYEDSIFLLFKPEFPGRFRKFLNREYDRTKSIIADYDKSRGMVVLVYKLNKDFFSDYELIRNSRYSNTSKKYQDLFSQYVEILNDGILKKELSLQYRVFNKTPDLVKYWHERNAEYSLEKEIWYEFDERKETLSNLILHESSLLNLL